MSTDIDDSNDFGSAVGGDLGTEQLPVLRVRGPADLVQTIPYLLGFHPADSLVLLGLDAGAVVVTARLDLADLALSDALEHAVSGMYRGGAHSFVGVIFDQQAMRASRRSISHPLPWSGVADELSGAARTLGATVDDVLLVSRGRFWSYICTDYTCCSPDGTALAGDSIVAAAATYAGLVALPDRGSLAMLLEPISDAERDRLKPLLEDAERAAVGTSPGGLDREDRSAKRALFAACRASDGPGQEVHLTDQQLVRFGTALRRHGVRDSVWTGADAGRIDGRSLWRYLARRLPAPYDAAPLFLFAWCTYRAGDGALAGIAAQRALDSDPRYSAADLLLAALSHAVDPRRLPRLRSRRSA